MDFTLVGEEKFLYFCTSTNKKQFKSMNIMKRISYYIALVLMAVMPLTFTSCDPDDGWNHGYWDGDDWYDDYDWYNRPYNDANSDAIAMAQMLNGTWQGTIINEYTNDDGVRERTYVDADLTFTQYDQKAVNGTGFEVDYIDGKQEIHSFRWYIDIRKGNIYVQYYDDRGNSTLRYVLDSQGNSDYSGFSLYNDKFNGVMEGVNSDEYIFFDLARQRANNAPSVLSTQTIATKSYGKGTKAQFDTTGLEKKSRKR